MSNQINTLWYKGDLGYMERLSLSSAVAQGHDVVLYSYDPDSVSAVPDGVEVRHGLQVLDDPKRTRLFEGKYKAMGSNFFRYELFEKDLGFWMDLDVILLQKMDFSEEYIFGWESRRSINSAVLKLPSGSGMLNDMRNIPDKNWLPPHFGLQKRLQYYWMRLRQGDVDLDDLPWGSAGPAMLTYVARKHKKTSLAQPIDVFYPVPYLKAKSLFEDASIVEGMLTPRTRGIHMWNSALREWKHTRPPEGSFMDKMCQRFSVPFA